MYMMNWKKLVRTLAAVVLVSALVVTAFSGSAEAARRKRHAAAPAPDKYASIVIDASTGQVLSESNADKQRFPASLTKMMTLYLTFEALENGRLRKNDRLYVSRNAAAQEPSALGLKPGTTIRVEDAILGLVTKSANDAAAVLGESIGGSESGFGRLMTQKAHALGMLSTNFVNASGLYHPAQVSTARDMARLGQALVRDYPAHYRYFSTSSFTWAGKTFANHNHLMKTYEGMDGIKTGFVRQSGYNLVASARRDGRRIIGVVFGGRSTQSRNSHMAALLDKGFATLASGGPALASAAPAPRATYTAPTAVRAPGISATRVAYNIPQKKPQFDAMGLVMNGEAAEAQPALEEGDASDDLRAIARGDDLRQQQALTDSRVIRLTSQPQFSEGFRSLNSNAVGVTSGGSPVLAGLSTGPFAVQIGAFSTQSAGLQALSQLKQRLPQQVVAGKQPVVAPLMTNRGMIYRARLSGFSQSAAADACRVLKGNCLVLAAQ